MKIVKEEISLDSDSLGDSDLDIPPPVVKKKSIKVWLIQFSVIILMA